MQKHVEKLEFAKTEGKQVWTTPAGEMKTTTMKVRGKFNLPELHDNRIIEWDCHVTNQRLGRPRYDYRPRRTERSWNQFAFLR